MDIFEAMHSQRAMRRLKTDPVPDELVWKVLDSAVQAPSGGNRQPWNFIVIKDTEKKRRIGEWYLEAWNASYGRARDAMLADPVQARVFRSADYLANHIVDVPVLIIATVRAEGVAAVSGAGASIFPALQNLMLAARALGLGTTLTTLHRVHEADVKEMLGVPGGVETMAMIPLGWPVGKFGPPRRRPVEEVTYWDSWNATREKEAGN